MNPSGACCELFDINLYTPCRGRSPPSDQDRDVQLEEGDSYSESKIFDHHGLKTMKFNYRESS